ncbi:SDR family NAD(P)-dependent oxidoreductase [Novosphingobium lentum]|uniref:SDR family NAD(P)-dependent oxidoreductase n=1 Tax=Novosphingobium lentum TaxID=145287 RepID=UPI0008302393|nr:SDR family oxidoreductase [Novosphingobium lentum]
MTRLAGRVALVTGSLRGIGRAVVDRLHADGASVVVSDVDDPHGDAALAISDDLPGARYLQLDATSETAWQAARDRVMRDYGRLDILVNNVGAETSSPVQDMDLAEWRRMMAMNVESGFLGVKTFQPLLAQTGGLTPCGSSIVNVSSMMGLVALPNTSAYSTAKGAVRLFTKSIAVEFAKAGVPIRANSVHPGYVDTGMLRNGLSRVAAQSGIDSDALVAMTEQCVPIGRMARPGEIAGVIAFLASDDSSYMTGAELVVDGGITAM